MNIKKTFSPYYILIFFIIFILIFISVNYLGEKFIPLDDKYVYTRSVQLYNIVCFFPGTFIFCVISILNFSTNKKLENKKNMRVSLIPICLIGLLYLYIFLMLFYAVFIRDIGGD